MARGGYQETVEEGDSLQSWVEYSPRIKLEGVEGLPKLAISARPTSGSDEDFLDPKEVSALVIICLNPGSITDRPK
jgi:hypothetical protein